ncbi:hypothetical protein [Microbulbifer sp. TYP-18]|uniref:hypothetical protein n=1 Tax=Microbulbifer sp. TYP-18 TaxID=3230024 RepID=UPI0034C61518
MMDKLIIKVPASVSGVETEAMELTRSEVAELWIPITHQIINGVAVTAISGYFSALKIFKPRFTIKMATVINQLGVCGNSITSLGCGKPRRSFVFRN